jgi:hypothetical protein
LLAADRPASSPAPEEALSKGDSSVLLDSAAALRGGFDNEADVTAMMIRDVDRSTKKETPSSYYKSGTNGAENRAGFVQD